MDEILSEFRREYAEPEDETMEQDLPADEPEDEGTVPREYEETETEEADDQNDDSAQEELPVYSVRDILRDYRLMTMESRYEEEARESETLPPAEPVTEKTEKTDAEDGRLVYSNSRTAEPVITAEPAETPPAPSGAQENFGGQSAAKPDESYAFHDILKEFMQMPDEGEHAPVQQKMPEPKPEETKAKDQPEDQKNAEKPSKPAGQTRAVKEEFPESPRPDGEPFVDTLDYAAIFKMFANPEEAGRFEEVKPDSDDDSGTAELLDRAAKPEGEKEPPAEDKKPLFAEESPDFRDILREFMMGDQHPIYADMPGIGKKAEPPAERPPEKEEPPVPRRRREYHVEEDFPESPSGKPAEPTSETGLPAKSSEEPPAADAKPERERGLAGIRKTLSGLSIRRTENRKQALNSPRAFARYEDYLPNEEEALQALEAEKAKPAETLTPAESESDDTQPRSETAGAHLSSDPEPEKTETEQAEEDDALLYAGEFPSFGQWILNELMGFWIKLNGVGDRQSTATMQDDREELGAEVNVANASRYYGSQVTMLRMRTQIGLAVLAILAYITLGFPVSGMLKTAKVAAGMCLGLQLTVMLLCLDVVVNALINLTRGRFGADTLAVLAGLISCFDALAVATGAFGTPHIPLCLFSSLALMGILYADLLSARALRKATRVPAIGKRAYCVTAEEGVRGGHEITLLKSVRPMTGFVRRAEESPPDEMLFTRAAMIEVLVVLILSLLIGLVKHSMKDMLYILSAMLSCTVPVTALLAFALPFFIGTQRIFSSGAAVAGWSGIHDIGCSRNLIVTDRDLFPEETIAIDTVRVFADESAERVISYAGTMIAASGSGLGPCFADLMEKNKCRMCAVEDFKWLSGGGLQGLIEGHTVLCGGADLMQLMNVKVPYRLVDRTTVLLSIDGVLYGIFKINYTGLPEIRAALQELIASNRHPIFAIRDFIITPDMLHSVFDVATDGYDFPPYGDRFRISEARPSDLSQVSAVVCREGLGPLTHLADTGRSMYVAIRMNLIITALTAVLGTVLVFFRLIGPGVLNAWLPFVLMVLDAIFVMLISLFMRF